MDAIRPATDLAPGVHALTTIRTGGAGSAPYATFNLAAHVGDDEDAVARNRTLLVTTELCPAAPRWVRQVHGTTTVHARDLAGDDELAADAVYTDVAGQVCAVLTADCLPIVLAAASGREVAVVHAGWRGLHDGVVQAALRAFTTPVHEVSAWLGPGIGAGAYRVDADFRARFLQRDAAFEAAFHEYDDGWHADLATIADRVLRAAGCSRIERYTGCTFAEPARFFSYRRDGCTGRMATLAWFDTSTSTPGER